MEKITPAMQQYYDIKKQYSDCVVFFRMGDFYEMFGEDAYIANKILGINVTSRNKNAKSPEPLAGFPYHAKEKYLPLLINSGYKVAIVEQVSDPNLKGIVKREVKRVVTPSTLALENENYENIDNSIIVSIVKENSFYSISVLDINTFKFYTSEFSDFKDFSREMYLLFPKEVILDKNLYQDLELKNLLEKKFNLNIFYFEYNKNPREKLINHFKVKDLVGFGIEDKKLSIKSSALLIDYIEGNQKISLDKIENISYLNFEGFMQIDESTIKNLDIFYNIQTQSSNIGTLFSVLNKTKTPMGKRLLKYNLSKPLISIQEIEKRQNFISELLKNKILLYEIIKNLNYIGDIDIILNKISIQRSSPKDLLNLKRGLISIIDIYNIIEKSDNKILLKLIK